MITALIFIIGTFIAGYRSTTYIEPLTEEDLRAGSPY